MSGNLDQRVKRLEEQERAKGNAFPFYFVEGDTDAEREASRREAARQIEEDGSDEYAVVCEGLRTHF